MWMTVLPLEIQAGYDRKPTSDSPIYSVLQATFIILGVRKLFFFVVVGGIETLLE